MNKLRVEGIPTVVIIFSIALGLIGTSIGVMGLLDQTSAVNYVDGADRIALTWAGRNAGIGLAMLLAVGLLRNANAYVVAYVGALFKEGSDLADALNAGEGAVDVLGLVAFVVLEFVCFVICLRATRRPVESDPISTAA